MDAALAFVIGLLAGLALFWIVLRLRADHTETVIRRAIEHAEASTSRDIQLVIGSVKDSVRAETEVQFSRHVKELADSASTALTRGNADAAKVIEGKKELIDASLVSMNAQLEEVRKLMAALQQDRAASFGEIAQRLTATSEVTAKLQATTEELRQVLASPQARGQWGERMAEDVLRLAGLTEGINYRKQTSGEGSQSRPDFTFLLPHDLKVNMDVKFPFNSYLAYLESAGDKDRAFHRQQFLRDVRTRVKEVTDKDYINAADGTLGYVILFIPNEGIYSFIHESDRSLLDDALRARVVLCSPFTLYAVLAVMRQAIDSFALERRSAQVLAIMNGFRQQWDSFVRSFDKLGRHMQSVQNEYVALTTTRRTRLDKELQKIDVLLDGSEAPLEEDPASIASPESGELLLVAPAPLPPAPGAKS